MGRRYRVTVAGRALSPHHSNLERFRPAARQTAAITAGRQSRATMSSIPSIAQVVGEINYFSLPLKDMGSYFIGTSHLGPSCRWLTKIIKV